MKLITILLVLLLPIAGFSQIEGDGEVYLTMERIDAKFNGGGLDKFREYLNENFDYSKVTKLGKLEATFTIDVEGNVTKIRITQLLDIESATEFIRVLKKCPKWEPAKRGGKPISIEIKYPMVFNKKKADIKEASPKEIDSTYLLGYQPIKLKSNTDPTLIAPSYYGGINSFFNFVSLNFNIPSTLKEDGKINVQFVIDVDGSLKDIKVLNDLGEGTVEETIRVLRLSPKWLPAKKDGKIIRFQLKLPLSIRTSKGKTK